MARIDGRANDALRPVSIQLGALRFAEGSALISAGDTRVLCAASVEDGVPKFLRGSGGGWVTAEYAMLPRATHTRSRRAFPPKGRAQEIQRLIGRSLRAAVDMRALGERTITVDCDVIQADGGTRTAAITGACVALRQALAKMGAPPESALCAVAAVSVGVVDGETTLDLCYEEDSRAEVDFNVVMTDAGEFVEVQGTAERGAFSRKQLADLLSLAEKGIRELLEIQRTAAETAADG